MCTHVYTFVQCVHMCTHVYTYVHMCTHVHTRAHMCTQCAHVCTCLRQFTVLLQRNVTKHMRPEVQSSAQQCSLSMVRMASSLELVHAPARRGVKAPGAARQWWIEKASDEEAPARLRPMRRFAAHVALRSASTRMLAETVGNIIAFI